MLDITVYLTVYYYTTKKNGIAQIKSELSLKMNLRVEVIADNTVQQWRWLCMLVQTLQATNYGSFVYIYILYIYMEDP